MAILAKVFQVLSDILFVFPLLRLAARLFRSRYDIHDKVVWVVGASSGIGKCIAIEAAMRGAKVILSARGEEDLKQVAKLTNLPEDRVLVLPIDLAQSDTFPEKVGIVLAKFGRVDVLVNSGGISQRASFEDTAPATLRKLMEVNFFGPALMTHSVLPQMLKQKEGFIVNISSVQARVGLPFRSGYASSKHALHGLMNSIRAEHYRNGIRVLLACPGYVGQTRLSANALTGDGTPYNQKEDKHAISPEYCAECVLDAVYYQEEEVFVGVFHDMMGYYLSRLWPSLVSLVTREKPRQRLA